MDIFRGPPLSLQQGRKRKVENDLNVWGLEYLEEWVVRTQDQQDTGSKI